MSRRINEPDAEALAIDALGFLAEDTERLSRFLAITGIDPANLRRVAGEPHFLASILDHLASDEGLLLAFAATRRHDPAQIAAAHRRLSGAQSPE